MTTKEELKDFAEIYERLRQRYATFDQVKQLIERLVAVVKEARKSLADDFFALKAELTSTISTTQADLASRVETALREQERGMAFVYDRVSRIRDGKDGRDGKQGPRGERGRDGVDGLPGRDGKDGRDGVNADPARVAVLEARIKDLEARPIGRTGMRKVPIVQSVDLSSQCDGAARAFRLPKDTVRVLGVWSTQFPVTFNSSDWTFTGNTITLSSSFAAPESGQSLVVLIETLFYA